MNIQKEVKKIETAVQKFESLLRQYLIDSIQTAVQNNDSLAISITPEYITVTEYVEAEQVDYLVYIDDTDYTVSIEATKQGFSIGYLESDSDTYIRITNILRPIIDTYQTYFSWDGKEFVINLK